MSLIFSPVSSISARVAPGVAARQQQTSSYFSKGTRKVRAVSVFFVPNLNYYSADFPCFYGHDCLGDFPSAFLLVAVKEPGDENPREDNTWRLKPLRYRNYPGDQHEDRGKEKN